jgi:nucleotidyltransferase substrate binding protein (TIGR01987 family)
MNNKEIRWKQRFTNFEKAFRLLERALKIETPSEIEKGGIIQFYEIAFELSWKLLKDYLESLGYDVQSPRTAIKQSFQTGIINDGELWIEALEARNLTSHIYNEDTANLVVSNIKNKYYSLLKDLYLFLKEQYEQ